jgi:hypothetical protein
MNLILNKPYKLIWLTIPLILGLTLIGFNKTLDIQMHDTYVVIDLLSIGSLFLIILVVTGLL